MALKNNQLAKAFAPSAAKSRLDAILHNVGEQLVLANFARLLQFEINDE